MIPWKDGLKGRWYGIQTHLIMSLRTVRDSLVWLVPYFMVSSFFFVIASIFSIFVGDKDLADRASVLALDVHQLTPFAVTGAVSAMLAIQSRLPRPPVIFLNLAYVALGHAGFSDDVAPHHALDLFYSIILPFLSVPLLAFMAKIDRMRLVRSEVTGQNVSEALNLVIPGLITACVIVLLNTLFNYINFHSVVITPETFLGEPLLGGAIYALLNSVLWFFGIHGYYALLSLLEVVNVSSVMQAVPINEAFLGAFVFIGGSGATLSLIIALLLFVRHRSIRILAIASIPAALFNVNELLLFGLPIILNWRLFFPFVMVPVLNIIIAFSATCYGILPVVVHAHLPFNSPILFNAVLATDGGGNAVLVQVVCIVIGVVFYAPFVRKFGSLGVEEIYFSSFDTTLNRRNEEAAILLDDPVGQSHQAIIEHQQTITRLRELSNGEFLLHYQPLVNIESGKMISCESLLRIRRADGSIGSAFEFLPWLARAGAMRKMDLWVVSAASRQIEIWQAAGVNVRVSVNITPESLGDPQVVEEISGILAKHPGHMSVEIIENSLVENFKQTRAALETFRSHGALIYIDDFGTHYSSLSYLHQFPVDAIKIDRSFVLALDNPRGQQVFTGLLDFARRLDLKVVVEGIETSAQLDHLPMGDGILVQGWYYSKARDADSLVSFMHERSLCDSKI